MASFSRPPAQCLSQVAGANRPIRLQLKDLTQVLVRLVRSAMGSQDEAEIHVCPRVVGIELYGRLETGNRLFK